MADTSSIDRRFLGSARSSVGKNNILDYIPRSERSFKGSESSRRESGYTLASSPRLGSASHRSYTDSVVHLPLHVAHSINPAPHAISPQFVHSHCVSPTPEDVTKDLTKGTLCVRKKKIAGLFRFAVVSNQVWCVTDEGLRVVGQNARDITQFEDQQYTSIVGAQNRVFAATRSGVINVFDTQLVDQVARLEGHTGPINALCVCSDGVWSAGVDGSIRLWELETGNHKRMLSLPASEVEITCLATHRFEIWAGAENGNIYIFDPTISDEPREVLQAHSAGVHAMCVNENQIWCGSDDRAISIWDAHSKREVTRLSKHSGRVGVLANVGSRIWSGAHDSKVGVWNPKKGELIGFLPGGYSQIYDIAVVGLFVWVATKDELLRIFISQNLLECAQADLNKYCLSSVEELDGLLSSTVLENIQLYQLLRTLYTQLMRSEAWYSCKTEAVFLLQGSGEREIRLPDLAEKLQDLEARWLALKEQALEAWDLPTMARELQANLRSIEKAKCELAEIRALFNEFERNAVRAHDTVQTEFNWTVAELSRATKEIAELRADDLTLEGENRILALQQEVSISTAKSAALQRKLDEGTRQLEQLTADMSALTEGTKVLEKKSADLVQQTRVVDDAAHSLRLDNDTKEREVQFLKDQLAQKTSETTTNKQELEKVNPITMDADLKKKQERLTLVEKQLRDVRAANSTLTAQTASLKTKAKQLEEKDQEACCVIM
eukprot:gnl/Hemi2/7244_TR2466_c0_g1_i1.p1 gnl/Hemi2/7244_TR2466_c0_g1~~gnl/Hemi2/7244_TR2466_c0_g1_i1.p1  ORF type:complete len:722 (+),score=211.02 gnl/Hemi2/7244_TR2466_c0_g1_i1:53-2218(+)